MNQGHEEKEEDLQSIKRLVQIPSITSMTWSCISIKDRKFCQLWIQTRKVY